MKLDENHDITADFKGNVLAAITSKCENRCKIVIFHPIIIIFVSNPGFSWSRILINMFLFQEDQQFSVWDIDLDVPNN